jgi:predicted methyltransferase
MAREALPIPLGQVAVALLLTVGSALSAFAQDVTRRIDDAIAGSHRPEKNRARDVHRHPRETLLFFGLRPEMTVVEIWPAAGWYTEIIAPVLRGAGRYYAAHVAHEDPDIRAGSGSRSRTSSHASAASRICTGMWS